MPSRKEIQAFRVLLEDVGLNLDRSLWAKQQGTRGWSKLILDEAQEIIEAQSPEHIGEELGDILWNTLTCIRVLEQEGGSPMEEIFLGIAKKIRYRKPWIFEDRVTALSPEEENKLWDKQKEKLK